MPISRLAVILLLTVVAGTPCSAMVIDNFEDGAFSLMTNSVISGSQAVTPGLHCVANTRYVGLGSSSAAITIFSQLDVASLALDHEMQCVFTGGGRLELEYLPNPTDLTAGGILGRLDIMVSAVDPANFDVQLELEDLGGTTEAKTQVIPGVGVSAFFLSDFPGIDPTQIVGIKIVFSTNNQGDLHVSDIRMRKVAAAVVSMDAHFVSVSGPPYPTQALQFDAYVSSLPPSPVTPPDPAVPVELLGLSLAAAQDFSTPPNPIMIEFKAADSGGGFGVPGAVAKLEAYWTGPGSFPASAFFDIATMVDTFGGIQPCTQDPVLVDLDLKAFKILFEVEHTASGNPSGTTDHVMIFEIGNQPLVFAGKGVSVPPDPCRDPEFHTEMSLREVQGAPTLSEAATTVDPDIPLFTITIMADHGGGGAVAGLETKTDMKAPLVGAYPSVMRSRTTFRVNAAFEHPVDLVVHDVMGRVVERIRVPVEGSVVWKGTDRWGRVVPAGVYLVKTSELSAAPVRIVKLP